MNKLQRRLFFLTGMQFLLLTGCGSVPNANLTPSQAAFRVPKATDIKSLNIDGDFASQISLFPNDSKTEIKYVLTMLQTAKPVSVQFPKLKKKVLNGYNAYIGPAILNLNLSTNEEVVIAPAHYIWSTWQGAFDYHYVNGVVEYRKGDSTIYLRDSSLYNWLKQDQWKSTFHM